MGGVAVELEGCDSCLFGKVEDETLPAVAKHDGMVAIDGHSLCASTQVDRIGKPQ